jgi:hypothetical protein
MTCLERLEYLVGNIVAFYLIKRSVRGRGRYDFVIGRSSLCNRVSELMQQNGTSLRGIQSSIAGKRASDPKYCVIAFAARSRSDNDSFPLVTCGVSSFDETDCCLCSEGFDGRRKAGGLDDSISCRTGAGVAAYAPGSGLAGVAIILETQMSADTQDCSATSDYATKRQRVESWATNPSLKRLETKTKCLRIALETRQQSNSSRAPERWVCRARTRRDGAFRSR